MKFLRKINLEINKDLYNPIQVKQGDNSRYLLFNLLDNGVPFSLENKTVRVYGLKPDGTKVFNNLTIINAAKGLAELQLTTQMLIKPGCLKLELVVYEATDVLSTTKFDIDIIASIRDDEAIESTNEFSALNLALAKADEYAEALKQGTENIELIYATELNGVKSHLEEGMTQTIVNDIEGTEFKSGRKIDVEFIRSRQVILYGEYQEKMRQGKLVQICCMGDSMTYGQDTISEDRVEPDPILCPDGSRHTQKRASETYPQALQKYLRILNNNTIVINRGYSGDYTYRGLTRWNKKHSSDLTILMYGTNDSQASFVPEEYRNINAYITYFEQLLIREILWNKACIILTPPRLKWANNRIVDIFANSLFELGQKYNIPVVDSEMFFVNQDTESVFSDGTHYNAVGYRKFAASVASVCLTTSLENTPKINSNRQILFRPSLDNISWGGEAGHVTFSTSSGAWTPDKMICSIGSKGAVAIPFYQEEDNLCFIPSGVINGNGKLKITLDFGTSVGRNFNTNSYNYNMIESKEYNIDGYFTLDILSKSNSWFPIIPRGWHTLIIQNTGEDGSVIALNSIEFNSLRNTNTFNNNSIMVASSVGSEDVTTKTFNIEDICKKFNSYFGASYYQTIPLKLVMQTPNIGIIEYIFAIGSSTSTTGWYIKEINRIAYQSGDAFKEITNLTYNPIKKEITLTFNSLITFFACFVQPL